MAYIIWNCVVNRFPNILYRALYLQVLLFCEFLMCSYLLSKYQFLCEPLFLYEYPQSARYDCWKTVLRSWEAWMTSLCLDWRVESSHWGLLLIGTDLFLSLSYFPVASFLCFPSTYLITLTGIYILLDISPLLASLFVSWISLEFCWVLVMNFLRCPFSWKYLVSSL